MRPLDPRLLRYARATAVYVVACVVIGAATAALVIAQAELLAGAIGAAFSGDLTGAVLRTTLVALGVVVLGRAVLAWVQEVAAHRASAAVKQTLRRRLLDHVVALGPSWLVGERKAALTTLTTAGLDSLDGYFARYLPQLVLALIVPGAVVAWMFTADLISAVTVALTLPLIPIFMVLVGLATRAQTRRRWRALAVLAHHFADVLAGLPTLKIFGRAKAQAEAVRRVSDRHRGESLATLRIAFLSSLVLELLATLSVALVAVGVGLRLVDGRLDLKTALLALILAPEAYLPLRLVGMHFHASADGLAAADEAFRVLETPAPRSDARAPVPDLRRAVLTVADLAVRYPDRDRPALSGLSFELRPGEIVAVAGESGAGKSTLLGVLLGFVPPASGEVRVGGIDASDLDVNAWRAALAWVPQRPALLAGTIADNVRLGAPQATDSEVVAALAAAGAADLDPGTVVGERGAGLSAGQVRRVALARAFLRAAIRADAGAASLLLLDEPTAGLDAGTEAVVARNLRESGHTTLLVTHRPALLTLADRVVEVPLPPSRCCMDPAPTGCARPHPAPVW
ncbi:thiol reductant ABC exporter subunit CydD [Actinopolymorpha alba]|uniref:thiol reductant ABC exporter subunit CydD n=1 Tax=Actinopolymorpha alba TaxID=533267 RepID=UPI0003A7A6D6|nr:thiol reductant ABC exporter subunit CydD [Actinopolymorpha alba]